MNRDKILSISGNCLHAILFLAASNLAAAPDWARPALGEFVTLKIDHGYSDFPHLNDRKSKLPESIPTKELSPGDLVTDLIVSLVTVGDFPLKPVFSSDEIALLDATFSGAEWEDIFDMGVVGLAPDGCLVFKDSDREDLAWIMHFWGGAIRLFPAKRCADGYFQEKIGGKSTSLNGAAGRLLAKYGKSRLNQKEALSK